MNIETNTIKYLLELVNQNNARSNKKISVQSLLQDYDILVLGA